LSVQSKHGQGFRPFFQWADVQVGICMLDMCAEMHVSFHVRCLLCLSSFNYDWKIPQYHFI